MWVYVVTLKHINRRPVIVVLEHMGGSPTLTRSQLEPRKTMKRLIRYASCGRTLTLGSLCLGEKKKNGVKNTGGWVNARMLGRLKHNIHDSEISAAGSYLPCSLWSVQGRVPFVYSSFDAGNLKKHAFTPPAAWRDPNYWKLPPENKMRGKGTILAVTLTLFR